MTGRQVPNIRQKHLGSELRKLRESARISQKYASEHIDGGQAKLSKIETGRQHIRRLELIALLDLYEVGDPALRESLLSLLRDTRKRGWWHQHDDTLLDADAREMLSLEADCDRIAHFSAMVVPDLLQTPEYARALIEGLGPHLPQEQVRHRVELRVQRQRILDRDTPPQFICVLDEGVLHRPVGGPEVMAAQLRRLVVLGRRPRTLLQVVPLCRGVHPGLHGTFRVLFHSSSTALDVLEVTDSTGSRYLHDDAHVETHRILFDEVRAAALPSRDSLELITHIATTLASTAGNTA
jgi:transcriptional regulator with XRE-family HTH domain